MNKEKFTFELLDRYTPDIVVKNSLEQIEKATKGYVMGNIEKYDGPVHSYPKTEQVGLVATLGELKTTTQTVMVDIQEDLGEQDSEQHRFEVFLSVRGLEHYKYRMMFIEYSAISYPVTIVMDEEMAIIYSGRRKAQFIIGSMKELEEMMDAIINSDTMISLIQNLINESLRQESKMSS